MGDVDGYRGLGHLRTAVTAHLSSKPTQKGIDHLELFLLGREKQRLAKELARLELRQRRIHQRLAEIHRAVEKRSQALELTPDNPTLGPPPGNPRPGQAPWRKMSVGY